MTVSGLKQTYLKVSGINLYCEYILNDKPPILLIHGFASSTYTFRRIVPLLQEHYSVVAVDLPGFGKSEKSTSFIYSFQNYAKLMLECMEQFGYSNAHIVAHSMGGQIALYMAMMAPEKVNKLVLLCSSGYLKRAKKPLVFTSYLPYFEKLVYHYIQRRGVIHHLKNVFFDQTLINDEMIREFGKPLDDMGFYKALIRLLRHREGDLLPKQLNDIQVPTLLIWGEEDRVVPVGVGKRLVSDLPDAQLITYEKTGHLITEERPELVFKNIMMHIN
ncbi:MULTISPECIES: alpha/beta hydrolase [unclassified Niallia]|uniref:alpha/beta fold hydrolase n=1 Tax=Niallia TaxID=2837506 RepID=UPI00177D511C|nr:MULTISPECIES: alpha/beta hydrolase [unclassified Niallia]MBE0313568.1 alpha/beta hydrolase [Xanthomonas citri pv. punicae]MCM3034103.1 alpha/beta hydrolase [Niallia sp. MER 6]MDL0435468.1 alpha/beta hydrolase [Niallia sp. SS-2023]UPO87651.1 alpha/beta hydrolase [Niallia sp. Man26]